MRYYLAALREECDSRHRRWPSTHRVRPFRTWVRSAHAYDRCLILVRRRRPSVIDMRAPLPAPICKCMLT